MYKVKNKYNICLFYFAQLCDRFYKTLKMKLLTYELNKTFCLECQINIFGFHLNLNKLFTVNKQQWYTPLIYTEIDLLLCKNKCFNSFSYFEYTPKSIVTHKELL